MPWPFEPLPPRDHPHFWQHVLSEAIGVAFKLAALYIMHSVAGIPLWHAVAVWLVFIIAVEKEII